MIEDASVISRNPRVVFRELADGGGGVLLHLDTAAYHGLNETGALIWSLLEDGPTFARLLTELRSELEDAPPTLRGEIADFLAGLEERGLVLVGAAATGSPHVGQP